MVMVGRMERSPIQTMGVMKMTMTNARSTYRTTLTCKGLRIYSSTRYQYSPFHRTESQTPHNIFTQDQEDNHGNEHGYKGSRTYIVPINAAHCIKIERSHRKWLGVSASLSQNSRIPALGLRVAFVVLALFHGVGIAIYLAIWALTPFRIGGQSPMDRLLRIGKQIYESIFRDELKIEN